MEDQYLIYENARQDVSEKDSKDTVSNTDQYLETLMSSESGCLQYFCLIMKIFYNIMIGASTVMLECSYMSIAGFFMFPFWLGIAQFNLG